MLSRAEILREVTLRICSGLEIRETLGNTFESLREPNDSGSQGQTKLGGGSAGNLFNAPVGEHGLKLRQQPPLLRVDDAVRVGQRQNTLVFRVGKLVVFNSFLDQFG